MTIVSSTFTEGAPQADGRRYVKERHTDDAGEVYEFEWLGSQDVGPVLEARAAILSVQLAERAAAEAQVAGTLLPLTKFQFRKLFGAKQGLVDEFNASFETNPALTAELKRAIRSGLENYRTSGNVARPFLPEVVQMVGLYQALGMLTAEEAKNILEAGNG